AAVSKWETGLLAENDDFHSLPFPPIPPHRQHLRPFLWKFGGVFRRARLIMNEVYDGKSAAGSADVLRESMMHRSNIKTSVSEGKAALQAAHAVETLLPSFVATR
ncbi:hypothetical protein TRAPUB_11609, partial [Trametes pubescens]